MPYRRGNAPWDRQGITQYEYYNRRARRAGFLNYNQYKRLRGKAGRAGIQRPDIRSRERARERRAKRGNARTGENYIFFEGSYERIYGVVRNNRHRAGYVQVFVPGERVSGGGGSPGWGRRSGEPGGSAVPGYWVTVEPGFVLRLSDVMENMANLYAAIDAETGDAADTLWRCGLAMGGAMRGY